MEQLNSFKAVFFKTKVIYTAIFFFIYILYIIFGTHGRSLGFFVPVLFISAYYILIGILRLMLRFFEIFDVNITPNKLRLIDLTAEILFYATSGLLIWFECGDSDILYIVPVFIFAGDVTLFYLFRKMSVFNA